MTDTVDSSAAAPPAPLDPLSLNDLNALALEELIARATSSGVRVRPDTTRHHIAADLAKFQLSRGGPVTGRGLLEINGDHGVLRWPEFGLRPSPEDLFVPAAVIRSMGLQPGLMLDVTVRGPREREHGLVADAIQFVEGIAAAEWQPPVDFDKLTPLFPNRRIFLESKTNPTLAGRAVDLISPLGMGQRGLIVAPPRTGKTMLLKAVAQAIKDNHPDVSLILLLVDERPEEVTDMKREIGGEIYSSTFDEPVKRHVQVCEAVNERAKRLVELKKDVVILVDSITRVARGYNGLQPGKGRTMSGGVDSKALARPRKFFGSARNIEEGGSLTILATALIETQSRMDDLIFEEFKGTGNMEVVLDRGIADLRIFPAIHITRSGTRREELLYHPDELERVITLRRQLSELPAAEAMEALVVNLENTDSNAELLLMGLRGV